MALDQLRDVTPVVYGSNPVFSFDVLLWGPKNLHGAQYTLSSFSEYLSHWCSTNQPALAFLVDFEISLKEKHEINLTKF